MGTVTRMNLIASLFVALSVTANADVVTDWNDKVVTAGVKASQAPFVHTRSAAIVHAVIFDEINSIDRPKFHRGRKEGRQQQWSLAI